MRSALWLDRRIWSRFGLYWPSRLEYYRLLWRLDDRRRIRGWVAHRYRLDDGRRSTLHVVRLCIVRTCDARRDKEQDLVRITLNAFTFEKVAKQRNAG